MQPPAGAANCCNLQFPTQFDSRFWFACRKLEFKWDGSVDCQIYYYLCFALGFLLVSKSGNKSNNCHFKCWLNQSKCEPANHKQLLTRSCIPSQQWLFPQADCWLHMWFNIWRNADCKKIPHAYCWVVKINGSRDCPKYCQGLFQVYCHVAFWGSLHSSSNFKQCTPMVDCCLLNCACIFLQGLQVGCWVNFNLDFWGSTICCSSHSPNFCGQRSSCSTKRRL